VVAPALEVVARAALVVLAGLEDRAARVGPVDRVVGLEAQGGLMAETEARLVGPAGGSAYSSGAHAGGKNELTFCRIAGN
jgi:hypothetical protein